VLEALRRLLVAPFEGLHRLVRGMVYPYICPAGYATQGFGLLVEDLKVPPITPAEASARLDAALPAYAAMAYGACPALCEAPAGLQIAVIDFVFNLGVGRFRASTLRRKLMARDWEGAAAEFPKWVYGGGRKLPGLVARAAARQRVAAMSPAELGLK
jgi:lysozyme